MLRYLIPLVVLLTTLFPNDHTAVAQTAEKQVDAWSLYELTLYAAPGTDSGVIANLPAGTGVVIEGRSSDDSWVLVHVPDETIRGWIPAFLVYLVAGLEIPHFPVTDETLTATSDTSSEPPDGAAPVPASLDEATVYQRAEAIDLVGYPIVPTSFGRAQEIFERGLSLGRNPAMLSKVGDCNSTGWVFLHPFGENQYDLGAYSQLEDTVEVFAEAFSYRTYAAYNGLNAGAVLDPIWAHPEVCEAGETPLLCDYRVHNSSVAVIMFGTNDMLVLTPAQFDRSLRQVVNESIQAGVIPLLSTFPRHLTYPDRSVLLNKIVVQVALDFDIPLINLWLALEPLPDHGIAEDAFHLNGPLTRAGDMSEPNLQTGFPMRNLVTLQALDALWHHVLSN